MLNHQPDHEAGFLRIRDLVQRSGVSKETIHYYIREGLLPKPRKSGKNVAEYDDGFVGRIRFIKELQDRYFFPLAVIKNIFKKQKKIDRVAIFSQSPKRVLQPRRSVPAERDCR